MKNLIHRLDRAVTVIALAFGYLAAISAILLTLVVTYGVVMRSIFHDPQNWTDQIASYSLLWIVFFGLAYTLSTGSHIRVDFFTQMLPPRSRYFQEIAVWIVGLVFSVLLLLGCLAMIENFIHRNTHSQVGFQIPLYWPAAPMVLGAALFGIVMLTRLIRLCTDRVIPAKQRAEDGPL